MLSGNLMLFTLNDSIACVFKLALYVFPVAFCKVHQSGKVDMIKEPIAKYEWWDR